jgi:hypothetical protein
MKEIVLISLLLLLAGQASANSYFKVIDVSPIIVAPNSEANFTVVIRSEGGSGAFAEPIFKFNATRGLSAEAPGGLRYIVATGSRLYNCTIRAGDVAPGNYSLQVGVYAQDAPYSWRSAYAIVEAPENVTNAELNASRSTAPSNAPRNNSITAQANKSGSRANKSGPAKTPGPGVLVAIAALFLASRRAKS